MIQKCKKNITEGRKTTSMGVLLFATGIGLLIDQRATLTTTSSIVFGSMCLLGIILCFMPDTFFNALGKYITKYSEK